MNIRSAPEALQMYFAAVRSFWGVDENGQPRVIDELETIAAVETVKDALFEHLEGGRFATGSMKVFYSSDTARRESRSIRSKRNQ